MKRMLIENGAYYPRDSTRTAIDWLKSVDGGTIAMDLKQSLMNSFDTDTDTQFDKLQAKMRGCGIRFSWRRGNGENALPHSGNVVALFPTKWLIDEMESRNLDALLVVGWSEHDYRNWASEFDVETFRFSPAEEDAR